MAVDVGIFKKYQGIFTLEESHLRKMDNILRGFGNEVAPGKFKIIFSVYRSDQSYYTSEKVDEVIADENNGNKKIKKIEINLLDSQKGFEKNQCAKY